MSEHDWLAERFEADRAHLRAVAFRMLGSRAEADDAVQEAWLRLSRADTSDVANLTGWLTTVVARVSLDMLRTRAARREEVLDAHAPPALHGGGDDEMHDALFADGVGPALLVVLDTLAPAERLAFVLHDLFGVSFDEIAGILGKSPAAARQLASRARRRVRGASTRDVDRARQRAIVDAFLAASRDGDFDALVSILDPNVVFRIDTGGRGPNARPPVTGAEAVARHVLARGRPFAGFARPAIVNGRAGALVATKGVAMAVVAFTSAHRRIHAIDVVTDPAKLPRLT
jgi:RNA polymerase sigma-70 factor (ECF subfamily)